MMLSQGLNSQDWQEVNSKVKRANVVQLTFLKQVIDSEMLNRTGQQ